MGKVLKAGMLCLVVGALVWLVTLWRWQTAAHEASGADIVANLLVLPLLLSGVLLAALWGVGRLRADAGTPALVPAGSRPVDAEKPAPSSESERRIGMAVWRASVNLSAGSSPEQALTQLASVGLRPSLDPELQDLDGAPVFTARLPDLDVKDWRERLPAEVSDRVVRALALLQAPADEVLEHAVSVAEAWPRDADPEPDQGASSARPAHLSGMASPPSDPRGRTPVLPRLSVRLAVPSAWTEAEREHAFAWLRVRCGLLAEECGAFQDSPPHPQLHPVDHPEAVWSLLDQQCVHWSREASAQWGVVLAADSAIDEAEIVRRQGVGELFTSMHQTARIPGEGAVGLLLTTAHWPTLQDHRPLPARLSRPVRLRRDKSADGAGRVGPDVLREAMTQALGLVAAPPDKLSRVLADGDHRASRTAELFEALQALAPQLDPMVAVTRVGEACGDLGLAGALVPVALAADLVLQDEEAGVALAVLVQSGHERVALALTPWTWTAPPAQAAN